MIVLVFFWAALHDRPVKWACDPKDWTMTALRPATLPSQSTLRRRLRRVDTAMLIRSDVQWIRATGDPGWVAVIDGTPLPVGGAGQDPEARCGRGAGMWAKGDTPFAEWNGRPVAEAYRVHPMNLSEDKVAEELIPDLAGGGYFLGDGEHVANVGFAAAGAAGYQRIAPPGRSGGRPGASLPRSVPCPEHRPEALPLGS